MTAKEIVHFFSGDDRYCGSTRNNQRFSPDQAEVTCRACMSRDTVALTSQGQQTYARIMADLKAAS
jgi:hypothetical protein